VEVGVSQLNDFVGTHLGAIGLVIFVGCVVLLLMILMLFIQSRRIALLSDRLDYLTQGADGESLEAVLNSHLETVVRVAHDMDEMQARTAVLEGSARLHFSRLGLVRFNPFQDTGGDQSFALAMLDANNDGFVVSSLHSRTGTRLYAKAVFGGEAESLLGAEEAQAVEIAVSQGGATTGKARGTSARGSGRSKSVGSAGSAAARERVAARDDGLSAGGLKAGGAAADNITVPGVVPARPGRPARPASEPAPEPAPAAVPVAAEPVEVPAAAVSIIPRAAARPVEAPPVNEAAETTSSMPQATADAGPSDAPAEPEPEPAEAGRANPAD
jgi:hypothetical protein